MYHRVGGNTAKEIDVPTGLFEYQVAYLRRQYHIVSLDDALAGLTSTAHDDLDRVVLTFDDGYRELYDALLPVLHRYRIPVTLYLPTSYIETGNAMDWGQFRTWPDPERPRAMTWDHIRTLFATGLVTIGSHTHSHVDLSRLSETEIRAEFEISNMIIEERLGVPVRHFAYPFGAVSPLASTIVPEYYRTAAIGGSAKNPGSRPNLHAMSRVPVSRSDGFWLFRLRLRSLRTPRAVPLRGGHRPDRQFT